MTTESELEGFERPPRSLWNRILAEPARAPEYIALAAADHFGPEAEEWVRIAGPRRSRKKLARFAYRKHVRLARLEGGLLGLGGVFTAAPDIVALLWIQSRTMDRLHRRLVRYLAQRLARHYGGKLIPIIGAPLGAMQNAGSTKDLGRLALTYYGGRGG
jgi:hypothetical protein